MTSKTASPFARSSLLDDECNRRIRAAAFMIFFSILPLLVLLFGCSEKNPVEPRESFKLTITIKDDLGNPMENVDIRRMNYLDACVLEGVRNAEKREPAASSYNDNAYNLPVQFDPGQEYSYSVGPIYPSPFNPTTAIRFTLKDSCYVTMDMLDWRGNRIQRLIEEKCDQKGPHQVIWTAMDDYGMHVIDGVYTCRLIAKDIDTSAEVFRGTANCTVYISLDFEQCHVIGQTNASGVFETTDRDLFPCVQGHPPQVCMDVTADSVGVCSFVDSVRIYMTITEQDPIEHKVGFSRKIKLINGSNSYTFTWEPGLIGKWQD